MALTWTDHPTLKNRTVAIGNCTRYSISKKRHYVGTVYTLRYRAFNDPRDTVAGEFHRLSRAQEEAAVIEIANR